MLRQCHLLSVPACPASACAHAGGTAALLRGCGRWPRGTPEQLLHPSLCTAHSPLPPSLLFGGSLVLVPVLRAEVGRCSSRWSWEIGAISAGATWGQRPQEGEPLLPGQIVALVSAGSPISSFIPSLYIFQNDINSPLWTLLGEHKRELAGRPKRKGG